MDVFPAAFPLQGLRIVVAGDGEAGDAKARLFDGSPCELVRVGPDAAQVLQTYAGSRLAFIALPGAAAVRAAAAARGAGALVNVVDRPELCDFNTPALIDRGAVVGAVATGGAAPLLAAELRREIEARWPEALGEVAGLIAALQAEARAAFPDVAARRAWLRRLIDGEAPARALAGDRAGALALARATMADTTREGRLSLLVPPAAPDLISLRALQALGRADLLVVAHGVDPALVALGRRDAPVRPLAQVRVAEIEREVASGGAVVCIGSATAFGDFGRTQRLPVADKA